MTIDNEVFGPGDSLLTLPSTGKVKVGSGIKVQDRKLVSLKCGVARQTSSGKIWIEGRQRRYFPTEGDQVVGIILERFGESWTVDIRGPFTANLPSLAFENVTRRNRPNLVPGDVIYARVVSAPRDADPEIACTDVSGRGAGFGQLKEGIIEKCSSALSRKLLANPTTPVLAALGAHLQYEIAVGMNCRFWLRATDVTSTILISTVILRSEFLTKAEAERLVQKMLALGQKRE